MDILKSSISRKTLSAFLIIVIMTATFAVVSISISINVLNDQTRNYYDIINVNVYLEELSVLQ